MWVIGHGATLQRSPAWRELMVHAHRHDCLFRATAPFSRVLTASHDDLAGSLPTLDQTLAASRRAGEQDAAQVTPFGCLSCLYISSITASNLICKVA